MSNISPLKIPTCYVVTIFGLVTQPQTPRIFNLSCQMISYRWIQRHSDAKTLIFLPYRLPQQQLTHVHRHSNTYGLYINFVYSQQRPAYIRYCGSEQQQINVGRGMGQWRTAGSRMAKESKKKKSDRNENPDICSYRQLFHPPPFSREPWQNTSQPLIKIQTPITTSIS